VSIVNLRGKNEHLFAIFFIRLSADSGGLAKCKDSNTEQYNCYASGCYIQGALWHLCENGCQICQNGRQNGSQERREPNVQQQLEECDASIFLREDEAITMARCWHVCIAIKANTPAVSSVRLIFMHDLPIRSGGNLAT
jgi:hypothetical protein